MASEAQMIELLGGLSSSDNNQRAQATKMYKDAKEQSPDQLVISLMKVVGFDQAQQKDKKSALVYLRQLLNKDRTDEFSFPKMQEANKAEIAQGLLVFFEKEVDEKVQVSIGSVITALAEFVCNEEDPRGWLVQGQSTGWPNLIPTFLRLSNCQVNTNPKSCQNSLKTLRELIPTMKSEIVRNQQPIGAVLQAGLSCPQIEVKVAATLFIVEMVEYLDKKDWAPLASTLPVLIQVCTELARTNNTSDLEEILQAFISVAGTEPDFFKACMASSFEPAKFLSGCVKSKEADDGIRNLALEWLTSYAEKKPKWLSKSVPAYAQVVLESCMAMMLEIEAGEAELKEWAERMDDEEGEEDADELYSNGEECIDRIAEAMSMESISGALFGLIGTFTQQDAWQAKHAALAAVKQTVEYVEEKEHMAEMAKLLMAHVNHPHPRVRYTALHAIGQLANDQAPQFQEAFHTQIMPMLMTCMDDKVDRVAAMAMSAFVSFAEELKDMMHQYSHAFMEKFLGRLQSSSHRGIQEESITAIAVIAAVVGEDFKQYYEKTMPLLKQLIMSCVGEKQQRLRGKAFECMSLLGVAVGKERFLPDAKQAIEAMLTKTGDVDDIQRDYIKEAIERICHCLKKDFVQFLPMVLPGLFASLNIEEESSLLAKASPSADGDDEPIEVNVNGKIVKVKSSKFEEMHQSVSMLNTFIWTIEEAYFDFIQPTAQALLPVIQLKGEAAMLFEDARAEAFTTWSYLIKAAKDGAQARQMQAPIPMVKELLGTIVQECVMLLQKEAQQQSNSQEYEASCEELGYYASGLSESLKAAGAGYLQWSEGSQIVIQLFGLMEQSFVRTAKFKEHQKNSSVGVNAELQGDEDDEDNDPMGDENSLRKCYEEALGAVMKAAPDEFATVLPDCNVKLTAWLSTKDNMVLGLHFACDMLEHLKERSCVSWPIFMPKLFDALGDKDADVRIAAAYAVNLAAAIPAFAEAAPEAFRRLAKVIGGKPPKKRDEKANMAMDNAAAAMFSLGRQMSPQCPPEVNPFAIFLTKLPLKSDLEEAKKVHLLVAQCLQQSHAGLIGANQENVGKILSVLAEIHKQEDTSNDEIDVLILSIFKALPREALAKFGSGFSEKQQKRIEKILTSS